MARVGSIALVLSLVVVAAFALRARDDALAAAGTVLDARTLLYHEDEPEVDHPRVLAQVDARLLAVGDGKVVLVVVASAVGPAVEPPPGPRGRVGANRVTSRELEAVADAGRIELVTLDADGRELARGSVSPGRRGALAERRVLPDGRFAWDRPGGGEGLLELRLETPGLALGRWRTELRVDGELRLRVAHEHDGRSGRILALEAVAGTHERIAP